MWPFHKCERLSPRDKMNLELTAMCGTNNNIHEESEYFVKSDAMTTSPHSVLTIALNISSQVAIPYLESSIVHILYLYQKIHMAHLLPLMPWQ